MAQTFLKSQSINPELNNGWIFPNITPTYASAYTMTVPSGAASIYQKGDKVRFKQGADYKYMYIIGVADTVLTLTGGSDYTVATPTAITDFYYSHQSNPMGFPAYFNFTPTITGGGGIVGTFDYTNTLYGFRIINSFCHIFMDGAITNVGSWSGVIYITLPVSPLATGYATFLNGDITLSGQNPGTQSKGRPEIFNSKIVFMNQALTDYLFWSGITAPCAIQVNGSYPF